MISRPINDELGYYCMQNNVVDGRIIVIPIRFEDATKKLLKRLWRQVRNHPKLSLQSAKYVKIRLGPLPRDRSKGDLAGSQIRLVHLQIRLHQPGIRIGIPLYISYI